MSFRSFLASLAHHPSQTMLIERILGTLPPQTDMSDPVVKVGICNQHNIDLLQKNEYIQCAKIGSDPPTFLVSMKESDHELQYVFENNTHITVKNHKGIVFYSVKTPTLDITQEMPQTLQRFYKPISMSASAEVDRIATFLSAFKNG